MDEYEELLRRMQVIGVNHLPVAAAFCRRMGLIETVDRVVPTGMTVGVGTVVQGMVLDTLSGRSPLYRLEEFFEHQDSRLLLGAEVPASAFNDTTVARAMDALYEAGAGRVFSEIEQDERSLTAPLGGRVATDANASTSRGGVDSTTPRSFIRARTTGRT